MATPFPLSPSLISSHFPFEAPQCYGKLYPKVKEAIEYLEEGVEKGGPWTMMIVLFCFCNGTLQSIVLSL